ncbi:MAG: RidA family protein [Candidatus Bathyarchaeia archaeon]
MLPSSEEARNLGYSQGVRSGKMLFISGQVALNERGEVEGVNDFEKQVRCVFRNLQSTLKSGGASLQDVVQVTVFLTDIKNLQDFRRIRREYFKDWFPSSTLVEVNSLIMKELMIEINAIAVVD